jgi:hypothetical protein
MQNWKKINLIALIIVLLLSLMGEYLVVRKYGTFTGGDTALHLRLTEELLRLKYPGSSNYPYPPGFHIVLALLSIIFLSTPFHIMKILQVFMLFLAVTSTAYFVFRKTDFYTTSILIMLLLSSPAFWDRSSQVIPQALDLILLPLAFYYFLEEKKWTFIAISTFLVYNHFAYAILPLGGLFLYSAINLRRFKEFAIIGVFSLPLVLYMIANISPILIESASIQNLQEEAILREPLFAIKYLGYPLFFLVFTMGIHQRFKEPIAIVKVSRYWTLSLIPVVIYFPDRFIEYVSQPLAIMGAVFIGELIKNGGIRSIVFLALFVFTFASLMAFYNALLTNGVILLPLNTLSPFAI